MFSLNLDDDKQELEIVAWACSIDTNNLREAIRIATKEINGAHPYMAVRAVWVKSRTGPTSSKDGGWIDADMLRANQRLYAQRWIQSIELHPHPSVEMMKKILRETPAWVATEIVDPFVQTIVMANHFAEDKIWANRVMVWNPAVLQIGHPVEYMAQMAENFGWHVWIKNCKEQDPGTKKWSGMLEYANSGMSWVGLQNRKIMAIHRGYDIEGKWEHRNQPIHDHVVLLRKKYPGLRVYFDPSHIYGPKMRESIVENTIAAMKMTMPDKESEYLYDGLLVEAWTSTTDTEQHITLDELFDMTSRLADIRPIRGIK